jgi:hypothetical protein
MIPVLILPMLQIKRSRSYQISRRDYHYKISIDGVYYRPNVRTYNAHGCSAYLSDFPSDWEAFCTSPKYNFTEPHFTTRIPNIRHPRLTGKAGRLEVKIHHDYNCDMHGLGCIWYKHLTGQASAVPH